MTVAKGPGRKPVHRNAKTRELVTAKKNAMKRAKAETRNAREIRVSVNGVEQYRTALQKTLSSMHFFNKQKRSRIIHLMIKLYSNEFGGSKAEIQDNSSQLVREFESTQQFVDFYRRVRELENEIHRAK